MARRLSVREERGSASKSVSRSRELRKHCRRQGDTTPSLLVDWQVKRGRAQGVVKNLDICGKQRRRDGQGLVGPGVACVAGVGAAGDDGAQAVPALETVRRGMEPEVQLPNVVGNGGIG